MNSARRLFRGISQGSGIHRAGFRPVSTKRAEQIHTPEEIRIPVPWGYIAGKWWGPKDKEPVIAIHGWQDNANSWDPVAKLLPHDVSFLAIDLPGNGISSHLPPFQSYYYTDTIGLMMRIKKHLRLGPLRLVGHSGGSAVSFMYSGVFPEHVHSYFGIDFIVSSYLDEDQRASTLGKEIDKKIEMALRSHLDSRAYTWEEAKEVWIKATNNSLDEKSSDILLKRGALKLPNGKYIFSRDHRLKTPDINIYTPKQVRKFAENITCHVHLVKGSQSPFMGISLKTCPDLIEIMKKGAKSFQLTELNGKHHLHMDIPEQFVPLLLDFWQK